MDKKVRNLNNTTPDILEIYELLLECVENEVEYVVMECSSQALAMHRLDRLKFDYGIFSNITEDHLDYHKTIDNYIKAKQLLFDQVNFKTLINYDDPYKDYFMKDNSITYGLNGGDYNLTDYEITLEGSTFKVNGIGYKTKLIGKHNLYNVLVVISFLSELNLDPQIVSELTCPPGRMDMISKDGNLVVVDYAHTPDAVEKIIATVRELNPNKIITIIGCGGDRDSFKRPIMSRLACAGSDYVIFTNDNPRGENPNNIISDMLHNLDKYNYEIILNRKKAIIKGIQMLDKNGYTIIVRKGHENYQIIDGVKYDFDDRKIVLENI